MGWFGLGRWRVCVGLGDGCRAIATVGVVVPGAQLASMIREEA